MMMINRRALLGLFGGLAVFGFGAGTVAGDTSASVTPISVDAANLHGYWASTRNGDASQED